MIIHGLQKMTLLDYPGKVACTVFLGGCDLRCPFCHNWELLDGSAPALMDEKELLTFLKKRQGLLEGVAFTGGEPLLRKELPELFKQIRELGYPIKLDTNGNHPEQLKYVVEQGLVDYVAMDIKNGPERYSETTGIPGFDMGAVRESAAFLLEGKTEYEFRTTVVDELHDEQSFYSIGEWIRGAEQYFLQKFTDRDTVPYEGFHAPDDVRLTQYMGIVAPFVKSVSIRG